MNLQSLTSTDLHIEAEKAARTYHKSSVYLLEVLDVVDQKRIYLEFGFPSLFKYCTQILNLSESVSYEFISVIKKGREVPAIKTAVMSCEITLSKAKKICSVIDEENYAEWIDLARFETSRVIEKCVAAANPKDVVQESLQFKTADRLELKLGVSEEWSNALIMVKDLLSQKHERAIGTEEALLILMNEYIQKNDPAEKAKRASRRLSAPVGSKKVSPPAEEQFPGTVKASDFNILRAEQDKSEGSSRPFSEMNLPRNFSMKFSSDKFPMMRAPNGNLTKGALANSTRRRPTPRFILHSVNLRDKNQCTFKGVHGRCTEKRWLEIHHVVPVSRGGTNTLENLKTLCHSHHRFLHRH